jgi:hypothetical protein
VGEPDATTNVRPIGTLQRSSNCTLKGDMGSMKRLPIAFMVGGLLFKAGLEALWKLTGFPEIARLLTTFDPGAVWFATKVTSVLFDQRRIAPTPAEATMFALLLILGFGLECLFLGIIVQQFRVRWRGNRNENPGLGAKTPA